MESYRSFYSPGNTEATVDSPQETETNQEAGGNTPEAGHQANESVTAPPRNTHTSEDTGPAVPSSIDPSFSPGNTEAAVDSPQETEAGGNTPEAGQATNESVTAPLRNTHTSEDTGPVDPFSVDPSSYTGRLQNLGSARESLKPLLLSLDVSQVSDRSRSKSNIYS